MIVEFETLLDDNTIHLPDDVVAQLKNGAAVHVSIRTVSSITSNTEKTHAWDEFLKVATERLALIDELQSYSWKRDDAYLHLK